MPVCPVATKAASTPARFKPAGDLDAGHHLAATAIVGDGVDAQAAFADAHAIGHVVLVVVADVDQLHAVLGGRPAELGIVAEKLVQAGDDRSFSARWPPG